MKNYTVVTFADHLYTETVDTYGNVKVYANVWKDDDRTATVRLAVADDNRAETFNTNATDLLKILHSMDNVQGLKLAVIKPYERKDGETTFLNISKYGGRISVIAEKPVQAIAKPGMVWVSGHYRNAPKTK